MLCHLPLCTQLTDLNGQSVKRLSSPSDQVDLLVQEGMIPEAYSYRHRDGHRCNQSCPENIV